MKKESGEKYNSLQPHIASLALRYVGSFAAPEDCYKTLLQSSTAPTYPAGVSLPDQWIPGLDH